MTIKPEMQMGLCQLDQFTPTQLRTWAALWGTNHDPVMRNLAAYALARANWREALARADQTAMRQWAGLADEIYYGLPMECRW